MMKNELIHNGHISTTINFRGNILENKCPLLGHMFAGDLAFQDESKLRSVSELIASTRQCQIPYHEQHCSHLKALTIIAREHPSTSGPFHKFRGGAARARGVIRMCHPGPPSPAAYIIIKRSQLRPMRWRLKTLRAMGQ